MKICMFTNTYLPHVGGVARSVHTFAQDLRRLGHEVMVVAPTFPGVNPRQEDPQKILRLPAIQNFNGSDFSLSLPLPTLIENGLDEFNPDIIHSHHPFLLGDSALRGARQRGVPLVFTHHTMYERYTHYVPFNSKAMQRLAVHLSTDYANLCTRVVAPSQSVAKLLRKRGVVTPIHEVPTGVDLQAMRSGSGSEVRRRLGLSDDTVVIGHLGRLAPEKNLEFLARSVARAIAALKDTKAVFMVVGSGPSQKAIREIFSRAGLNHTLLETGKLTGQDLSNAFQAMDLFAFASHTETQGMVLTEAMAAGTPVVALDAPGVREVVSNDVNGRLLGAASNEETLAQALAELVRAPDKRQTMREHALTTAEAFSRTNCAKRLLRVYEAALNDTPHRAQRDRLTAWDQLRLRLRTEWDLLSHRASAGANAVIEAPRNDAELE
ncbi:glycosyltransferase [Desulfohalobium retbaense]|uniref:Glycosyl transferase group 1 n=1 Tax=Desulfohalobium retbaense (strain ATCC 49708 / DSM 5692 / JCM 16813 / HR100) TaxID=485915 RepID=C8X4D8_DESRD|nr:glycosyltransferase [Desulfohalobium retbaense]ACV69412.1 glycosyl transferase group 1 [Desulfohalobium retbaense DSM 5692]